ncbi:M1 family metallopeptidase [Candidatus Gracilibacteria bacterium]|nr:M1 family metallopeptidase [Candidatus Gracilibacteria bacterium]
MKRQFKYYPEDFGDLTVQVLQMDLFFDVFEDRTIVESELKVEVLKEVEFLDLNAKSLEILEVNFDYEYLEDILRVKFGRVVSKGEVITIRTKTICRPTKNVLEGLYYDETPKGCPCQMITQCQQWGFQRIVPCIDDMTAKCFYKTRIRADERYTHLLSNGDVSCEVHAIGDGRVEICYDNVVTPMATYLFFLGVGTYAMFEREFVYPNGDKFMLQLLVPPGSDREIAEKALTVLHDAVMWVYLFTGPEKYANFETALKVKDLMERGDLAAASEMVKGRTWGYKYTGTVYREIGMQNSDFGGMENVGNTTITTNRIMPFPEMTDGSFEYMIQVKVHEFYHNLNGSEVTGRSPFEIWLNEAVTVFMEQEYHGFLFGHDYSRLERALTMLAPGNGTFAGDERLNAMPIEPEGFNDCNELITGVTYVKAPEFVRMIESLMGGASGENFARGLDLYHRRYKHSNASRAQWVECMEEVSGLDLKRMAEVWLKQSAYPKVFVDRRVEQSKLILRLEQKGFKEGMHWEFPFLCAIFDRDGKLMEEKLVRVTEVSTEVVFEVSEEIGFVSLNRGFSFFGKVFDEATEEELYLQVQFDDDICGRFMAFYQLAERQKMAILEGGAVSERFIDLYFALLHGEELMAGASAQVLTIFEQVEDSRFAHSYQRLYDAVKVIKTAVAMKYEKELWGMYEKYAGLNFEGGYVEAKVKEMKARQVKNVCLGLLAKLEKPEVWDLIKKQFESAICATDRVTAFSLYLNSKASDKMAMLREYQKECEKNLVSWESFLAVVAGNDSEDYLEIIRAVESSAAFRIEQANDQRALYCRFASNRKKSLLTAEGRAFLKEKILQLAPVNEYSCGFMVNVLANVDKVEAEYRAPLIELLKDLKEGLSQEETPSVYNNVERILSAI